MDRAIIPDKISIQDSRVDIKVGCNWKMDCQHKIACMAVMFSSSFTLDLIRHTQRELKKSGDKKRGRLVSFIISTLGQPGS